ncbi:hypothetical protein [Gandjariella thermophila]|uniref:Cardiolipin synthase N-terminal domain-containing protein n=1 Tax=Gandjariella thermophila TaxID=1931992 RepID=A0A4D4J448_9PSEU|nr:hypothetical protein [Gandjariella thermophila]GDY29286.1 hypothetical protein GTS_09190 [Gandjariella thermophila]
MTLATVQWVQWEQVVDNAALFGWSVLVIVHVMLAVAATRSVARCRLQGPRAKARWVLGAWLLPLVAVVWFVIGRRVLNRRHQAARAACETVPHR